MPELPGGNPLSKYFADPAIGNIPGFGQYWRNDQPELGYANWLSGINMAPRAKQLLTQLLPQMLQRHLLGQSRMLDAPPTSYTRQGSAPGVVQETNFNAPQGGGGALDRWPSLPTFEQYLKTQDPFALIREFLPMLYGSGEGMIGGRPQAGRRRAF